MNNEKNQANKHETGVEFSKENVAELHERQRERIETNAERHTDKHEAADKARHEIEQVTQEKESKTKEKTTELTSTEKQPKHPATRKKAYDNIIKQARTQMSPTSRAFSSVIHNPVVEKVSEAAGKTVARPNAILSGAVFAFLLTLVVYLIAKFNGYPLTGTETIAAFVLGWLIGNIYDFLRAMVMGHR